MRKVSGSASATPITTFRPKDPSMTHKQWVLQGRHSLQLIVGGIHPSNHPVIQPPAHCPRIHPPTIHPFSR